MLYLLGSKTEKCPSAGPKSWFSRSLNRTYLASTGSRVVRGNPTSIVSPQVLSAGSSRSDSRACSQVTRSFESRISNL